VIDLEVAYNLAIQIYKDLTILSMKKIRSTFLVNLFVILLCSCSLLPQNVSLSSTITNSPSETNIQTNTAITASRDATATPTPFQPVIDPNQFYWSKAVPQEWVETVENLKPAENAQDADLVLSVLAAEQKEELLAGFQRIYAIGAPFPTVTDNISLFDVTDIWSGGTSSGSEFKNLYLAPETLNVFSTLWGAPSGDQVKVVDNEALVDEVWNASDALVLVPFEDIQPRLKIMRIDGISPLDRPMDTGAYGLTVNYSLSAKAGVSQKLKPEIDQLVASIPSTNRDESKMAVVVMSGTTALARVTLKKIELNGYEYPVKEIKNWFLSADLRHVSNEVSFDENCEYTDPYTMQFCSKVDQIKVLENLGVNVVESTGNHLNDYGSKYFANTLKMYAERGWLNFGGGYNAGEAKQPALTEVNGNKVAFIGCNPVGPATDWATDSRAGSANCDYAWFYQEIRDLKSQGYIVIATYQFTEIDKAMYEGIYRDPFQEAAGAGADIVQGSQSHVPMGFEFVNNSLIHYGLGNLLFDQMEPVNIREFVDRHILYNGKYINTELLTATLTDWSKPVPMNQNDRQELLTEMFDASQMR